MTAIQALKELAYKITGKTPKSNTENGVITELADDYTPQDLSEYAKKSDIQSMVPQISGTHIINVSMVSSPSINKLDITSNATYGEIIDLMSTGVVILRSVVSNTPTGNYAILTTGHKIYVSSNSEVEVSGLAVISSKDDNLYSFKLYVLGTKQDTPRVNDNLSLEVKAVYPTTN